MSKRSILLLLSSAVLILIDQFSKIFLVPRMGWRVWYNEGISFSIQFGGELQTLFILLVFGGIGVWLWRIDQLEASSWSFWAAVLIVGGAIGNLIDRVRLDGRVLDFIALPYFPVFNFADICISMGVGALIVHVYLHERVLK